MIEAAATVGNFGAGFDVTNLALEGIGDRIAISSADEDHIALGGPDAETLPLAWHENIAGVVVDALRAKTNLREPLAVAIDKGQPAGSGLGSSASSAAGTALAFYHRHPDAGLGLYDLFEAAVKGEAMAGGGNADDVAAVLVGGLAVTHRTEAGLRIRRFDPPQDLVVAIALPDLRLPTSEMRDVLPRLVPRTDAIWNLSQTAAMLQAFTAGDVAAMGDCLEDRLALPYRAEKVPFLRPAIDAALDAGAYGGCLSGSGPAVVAICDDPEVAKAASLAMAEAVQGLGHDCHASTARPLMENPYETVLH